MKAGMCRVSSLGRDFRVLIKVNQRAFQHESKSISIRPALRHSCIITPPSTENLFQPSHASLTLTPVMLSDRSKVWQIPHEERAPVFVSCCLSATNSNMRYLSSE